MVPSCVQGGVKTSESADVGKELMPERIAETARDSPSKHWWQTDSEIIVYYVP